VVVSGNVAAGSGGGFFGFAVLNNVTVSGNSAVGSFGGGIFSYGLVATNTTVSGNTAGVVGGGIYSYGIARLTNVTITANSAPTGSGIYDEGDSRAVELKDSIIADNSPSANCFGSIESLGHNLDSANSCGFDSSGDRVNTDPMRSLTPLD
jgi:hypothetical protein